MKTLVFSNTLILLISLIAINHLEKSKDIKERIEELKADAKTGRNIFFEKNQKLSGWDNTIISNEINVCTEELKDFWSNSFDFLLMFETNKKRETIEQFKKEMISLAGSPEESCSCMINTIARIAKYDEFQKVGFSDEIIDKYNSTNGPNCSLGNKFYEENKEEIAKNFSIIDRRLKLQTISIPMYQKKN